MIKLKTFYYDYNLKQICFFLKIKESSNDIEGIVFSLDKNSQNFNRLDYSKIFNLEYYHNNKLLSEMISDKELKTTLLNTLFEIPSFLDVIEIGEKWAF